MKFELDEEQYALRDAVGRYLADHCDGATVRTFWDAASRSTALWDGLAGLGLFGSTVPAAHGGAGLGLTDVILVIEELGRHAVPHPAAETLGIVAPLLARHADAATQAAWLPRLASATGAGSALASVQDGWDGQAGWGAEAQLVLVALDDGVALCVPDSTTTTFPAAQDRARRPARLLPATEVARLPGCAVARELRCRAQVVYAQLLLGLGAAVIARAVDYARTREQFGRPIGSFQAIKHMLANAHVAIETARRSTWYAAWCIDHDRDHDPARVLEAAAVAKGSAAEAALEASYAGMQVHGAIGYTWECDLQLWLKRIHVLEPLFGGARKQWLALADGYFGTDQGAAPRADGWAINKTESAS